MTLSDADLKPLRASIDEIDDQMMDLLYRRVQVVREVARVKGSGFAIRPGREAAMLRRLVARVRDPLPPIIVIRLWRELIASMLMLEGPLSIAVCGSPGQEGSGLAWMVARDHFGAGAPITTLPGPVATLRAITETPGVLGVLPLPQNSESDPWWPLLLNSGSDGQMPRVIARLPIAGVGPVSAGRGLDALVVGRLIADPSGDDRSLIAVEVSAEMSRARFLGLPAAVGLEAIYLGGHGAATGRPEWLHLIEVAGYVAPDDPRLDQMRANSEGSVLRVVWLGAYALPLDLNAARADHSEESAS